MSPTPGVLLLPALFGIWYWGYYYSSNYIHQALSYHSLAWIKLLLHGYYTYCFWVLLLVYNTYQFILVYGSEAITTLLTTCLLPVVYQQSLCFELSFSWSKLLLHGHYIYWFFVGAPIRKRWVRTTPLIAISSFWWWQNKVGMRLGELILLALLQLLV
jgi:hypothetical protein